MQNIVRFQGVRKAFGPKVIYSNLTLDVREGETLTIMGGSGVGKSVMLKLLIRLLEPDAGSIEYRGKDVVSMADADVALVRQRIGMLFQGSALFDSLTVGENVAYGLHEHFREQMTDAEIDARMASSLALVGLPGIENMSPADLSGGMRKRVALARAIAVQPEILLYDEPTTGLDPINTQRINNLIMGLKRALNVTSIVVTHDLKSAFSISDRIAMVHSGGIIAIGTPQEIQAEVDPRVADFITGAAPETEDVESLLRG